MTSIEKTTELRFQVAREPLTYLSMANGHSVGKDCTQADIARACVYTCCYLWMLAHPDFRPSDGFRTDCEEYAHWLLEPEAYRLLTVGARSGSAIDLDSRELARFEDAFLARLKASERQTIKLQAQIPKGLWSALKAAYGIRHGSTSGGFVRLLMGVLRQSQALDLPSQEETASDA
jgi:hypothetical protein